jgi:hypothetical protein
MKSNLLLIFTLFFLQACRDNTLDTQYLQRADTVDASYSRFIPVDSANKMIRSYLNSIDYTDNDTDLYSLMVDASQLKKYINEAPETVARFKLMFAHKLDYINSGNTNTYAGYKRNALTLVIAACGENGDYIYFNTNEVLNYSSPCPPDCPPGEAESPILDDN